MAKNKKQNSDNNNSGANASYVDADVHSGEYRDKLYKIIDGLTKVTRRWDEMMDYSNLEGVQGICPDGWYIPTDDEWKILEGNVDSQYGVGHAIWDNINCRGFDVGNNLKSTIGWAGYGTDLYGFNALAGGYRDSNGSFSHLGQDGNWWSSSAFTSTDSWRRNLGDAYPGSHRNSILKSRGFSVRCLKYQ